MVRSVHHLTINIKDLAASERFYGEFLGLRRMPDVDMGDHKLYYYLLPGGCRLELIRYEADTGDCGADILERGRFRHLALCVTDLADIAERIEQYGGKILQPPRWVKQLNFSGMLAEDPNGCELEFVCNENISKP